MGAILFWYGDFNNMKKLGHIYLSELTDNKIDKASLRWILLNKKDIPISKESLFPVPTSFPFDVIFIDEIDLVKKTSAIRCYDKESEKDYDSHCIESNLKLDYFGRGKPYFSDISLKFSISHTSKRNSNNSDTNANSSPNTIWGCAVSDREIGLDLQFVRQVEYNEIAKKYFSKHENGFINKYGIDGFFQIWTRREAIGKVLAEGFFIDDNDFEGSVGKNFELLQEIKYKDKILEVFTHKFSDDLWGSCCILK